MTSHRDRESTYQKLSERFFWHGMVNDVKNYIKNCENCQRQSNTFKKISPQLQSIPVPTDVMKQLALISVTYQKSMDTGTLLYVLTIFQNGRKQKQQKIKVHQQ